MNRIFEYVKTVKWWAGLLGAGTTAALAHLAAIGTTVPSWLAAVSAVLTAVAVWELPYQPSADSKTVDGAT